MTDQPQGLKRDFSTRRPRRTVAELQKAREEEDKVKKEIGMEDSKPRRKGRRIITTKKSSCFSGSKNRNGLHTQHSSFSYHGDIHPDLMFCSPIPDDKSPLHEHHFPFVHQPFQPLLHGTKGSGDHKSHHSTPSASDSSVSKLAAGLPYGPATTSPTSQASRADSSLLSSNCVASPQPFSLPRPTSLDIQPHGHAATQSPLEFPEIKPFKASNSPYPQSSTGSSRHIVHSGYPGQQGYKSGSYPHSAPVQSYPHSPFQHHPSNSSMHCFPQTPQGYNYHQMHANTPPYQGPMSYYYPHPHDSKFRSYSEQKPHMPSQSQLVSRNQAPINLDSSGPDKQDLGAGLEFVSLSQESRGSGDSAPHPSCTNGLSASDNRAQVSSESDATLADTSERPSTEPAGSSTPDKARSHGKPPIQPHAHLHSKYKHDVTSPYHTPKYPSPWGPVAPAYADTLTPGDEFKKPQNPSDAGMRVGGNRKKGSIGMPPEFPGYGYPYSQQEPMGYQPPYYPSDLPYQSGPPNSSYNMQMLNQFPQDPTQHQKYKSNRRLSNPLEYSPTCPSRPAPKQLQRQGPQPGPLNPSQSPSESARHPFPPFPHPPPSSQQSPLPNSPTGSRSHSLSEIPPFPKPNQKFSTVVLPSPSLDRASTSHCLKTRDHPDLMEHLEKITNSCNKRELSYFDCLELTSMTAAHTHLIDALSTDTKTRYSLYEELNSILEVRRSSILRRYSTKPVRLKKQYLTKVLVEPVVPLEILIPSLSFLWSSPDKISSSPVDFYSSFPSFSPSDTPAALSRPAPASREDTSEAVSSDTDLQNKSDPLAASLTTPPDATSTPLTAHTSATSSSLLHTLPTSSNGEEPLPLLASSSLKHDSSLSDLNLSDCSLIPSDPESVGNATESNSDRKRHKSPELDSVDSKKCRSSPLVSENNSSLLDQVVGESASFSDQFQSLVQEIYGETTQFTLDKSNVSGMDIPLSLDQAIKEEMDSDKQESEQPNTALLFKVKTTIC